MKKYYTFIRKSDHVKKADMIQFLLKDRLKKKRKIVDIGCGKGEIKAILEKWNNKSIKGIDPVFHKRKGVTKGSCESLPLKDESYDMIIMNGVYFYIQDTKEAIDEMNRVLKKRGVIYITTPMKYTFIEPNYKLPMLSWLPEKAAKAYLSLTRKGKEYKINLETHGSFKKKFSKYFDVRDISPKLLDYYPWLKNKNLTKKAIRRIYPLLRNFNPNAKFICIKKSKD